MDTIATLQTTVGIKNDMIKVNQRIDGHVKDTGNKLSEMEKGSNTHRATIDQSLKDAVAARENMQKQIKELARANGLLRDLDNATASCS